MPKITTTDTPRQLACQTLFRGLEIVDVVANGITTLPEISAATGMNTSTAYRLATALVRLHYLKFAPRVGYSLGNKLIELGFLAHRQVDLPKYARRFLEVLALDTRDTVHLAVLDSDGDEVVYLDKVAGQRAVEITSRIGGHKPLVTTGVGMALLLDAGAALWSKHFDKAYAQQSARDKKAWLARMHRYAAAQYAFDLGDDDDSIRCVAAPIRNASGEIVAAISVSSTVQYMDDARMLSLIPAVQSVAEQISQQLGAPA